MYGGKFLLVFFVFIFLFFLEALVDLKKAVEMGYVIKEDESLFFIYQSVIIVILNKKFIIFVGNAIFKQLSTMPLKI